MNDNQKKFIPQLAIDAEFFHIICQSLYDVKPKAHSERLSQDGGRRIFLKKTSFNKDLVSA
jgi:hypothetical protein